MEGECLGFRGGEVRDADAVTNRREDLQERFGGKGMRMKLHEIDSMQIKKELRKEVDGRCQCGYQHVKRPATMERANVRGTEGRRNLANRSMQSSTSDKEVSMTRLPMGAKNWERENVQNAPGETEETENTD